MKSNQKGLVEVVIIVALIGAILAVSTTIFFRYNKNRSRPSNNPTPAPSSSNKFVVTGNSTFTTQGPTDAPTGEKPISATLLIGGEDSIRSVFKPVLDSNGEPSFYQISEKDVDANSSVRVLVTDEGEYKIVLDKTENMLCLVQKTGYQQKDSSSTYSYNSRPGKPCVIVNTEVNNLQINISQMGFGSNGFSCTPASECKETEP